MNMVNTQFPCFQEDFSEQQRLQLSNSFSASNFAQSKRSRFAWIFQSRGASKNCVLEVERKGALAMKKRCALRVGVAVAKRALRAEVVKGKVGKLHGGNLIVTQAGPWE